jgi:hypothetical protein
MNWTHSIEIHNRQVSSDIEPLVKQQPLTIITIIIIIIILAIQV